MRRLCKQTVLTSVHNYLHCRRDSDLLRALESDLDRGSYPIVPFSVCSDDAKSNHLITEEHRRDAERFRVLRIVSTLRMMVDRFAEECGPMLEHGSDDSATSSSVVESGDPSNRRYQKSRFLFDCLDRALSELHSLYPTKDMVDEVLLNSQSSSPSPSFDSNASDSGKKSRKSAMKRSKSRVNSLHLLLISLLKFETELKLQAILYARLTDVKETNDRAKMKRAKREHRRVVDLYLSPFRVLVRHDRMFRSLFPSEVGGQSDCLSNAVLIQVDSGEMTPLPEWMLDPAQRQCLVSRVTIPEFILDCIGKKIKHAVRKDHEKQPQPQFYLFMNYRSLARLPYFIEKGGEQGRNFVAQHQPSLLKRMVQECLYKQVCGHLYGIEPQSCLVSRLSNANWDRITARFESSIVPRLAAMLDERKEDGKERQSEEKRAEKLENSELEMLEQKIDEGLSVSQTDNNVQITEDVMMAEHDKSAQPTSLTVSTPESTADHRVDDHPQRIEQSMSESTSDLGEKQTSNQTTDDHSLEQKSEEQEKVNQMRTLSDVLGKNRWRLVSELCQLYNGSDDQSEDGESGLSLLLNELSKFPQSGINVSQSADPPLPSAAQSSSLKWFDLDIKPKSMVDFVHAESGDFITGTVIGIYEEYLKLLVHNKDDSSSDNSTVTNKYRGTTIIKDPTLVFLILDINTNEPTFDENCPVPANDHRQRCDGSSSSLSSSKIQKHQQFVLEIGDFQFESLDKFAEELIAICDILGCDGSDSGSDISEITPEFCVSMVRQILKYCTDPSTNQTKMAAMDRKSLNKKRKLSESKKSDLIMQSKKKSSNDQSGHRRSRGRRPSAQRSLSSPKRSVTWDVAELRSKKSRMDQSLDPVSTQDTIESVNSGPSSASQLVSRHIGPSAMQFVSEEYAGMPALSAGDSTDSNGSPMTRYHRKSNNNDANMKRKRTQTKYGRKKNAHLRSKNSRMKSSSVSPHSNSYDKHQRQKKQSPVRRINTDQSSKSIDISDQRHSSSDSRKTRKKRKLASKKPSPLRAPTPPPLELTQVGSKRSDPASVFDDGSDLLAAHNHSDDLNSVPPRSPGSTSLIDTSSVHRRKVNHHSINNERDCDHAKSNHSKSRLNNNSNKPGSSLSSPLSSSKKKMKKPRKMKSGKLDLFDSSNDGMNRNDERRKEGLVSLRTGRVFESIDQAGPEGGQTLRWSGDSYDALDNISSSMIISSAAKKRGHNQSALGISGSKRRRRNPWSDEETEALIKGYNALKYRRKINSSFNIWKEIKNDDRYSDALKNRDPGQLKDKVRNLVHNGRVEK